MPLLVHQLITVQPQLDTALAVNDVVNAGMEGAETAPHAAVGRIDNGIRVQGRYITLPQDQPLIAEEGWEGADIHHPLHIPLVGQIFVLYRQKGLSGRHGRTHIHQRPE